MSKLTENDLKRKIKDRKFFGVYLLLGDEKYLVKYYTNKMVEAIIGKNKNDFNLQIFDNDNMDINEMSSAVESLPLMAEKKCVLVNDLDLESFKEKDKFMKIVSDIPETTILIISYPTLEFDLKRNSKFKKVIMDIEKFGTTIEFEKRGLQALERQLVSWASKMNTKLSLIDASRIIKLCGDDLNTLKLEIEKLCAYVDYSEITEDSIEKVVTQNLETTVFVLANAVSRKDYENAFNQLNLLFYKKEVPISILAVLSSVFVDMYRVRVASEGSHDYSELSKYFDYKNKAFKLKNAQRDSKNISTQNIKKCIDILIDTDLKLKSTRIDKRVLMEELISKLMLTL